MAILTVAQFRQHVTTALVDEALQRLLDAAEEAILRAVGPYLGTYDAPEAINEFITVHGDLLPLSRRAESIESIIERTVTLAADDYQLRSSGLTLRRLRTGTHPSNAWRGRIDITYTPLSDFASRQVAQLELVKLDMAFNPNLASQTIGAWAESYQTGKPYAEQRADILASLSDPSGWIR